MADKKKPTFEDVWALIHENSKHIKELRDDSKETTAQIRELRAKVDDTTASVNKLSKNLGGLSNKWGHLGEAMTVGESLGVFNAIEGIEVNSLVPSHPVKYNGKQCELDGLAIGKDMVVVIEAKSTLKQFDVTKFINTKLNIFTKIMPIYEGRKIYGAMGFLSADDKVKTFAQEQGLLLILPADTNKAIVSFPKGFKLRNFHP